jgi:hypothetical protein
MQQLMAWEEYGKVQAFRQTVSSGDFVEFPMNGKLEAFCSLCSVEKPLIPAGNRTPDLQLVDHRHVGRSVLTPMSLMSYINRKK